MRLPAAPPPSPSPAAPSRTPSSYSSLVVRPDVGFGCFDTSSSTTPSSWRCALFAAPNSLSAEPSCWSTTFLCTARSTLPDSASPPIASSKRLCQRGGRGRARPRLAVILAASHPRPISKVADLDSRSGLSRGPDGLVVGFRRFGIAR